MLLESDCRESLAVPSAGAPMVLPSNWNSNPKTHVIRNQKTNTSCFAVILERYHTVLTVSSAWPLLACLGRCLGANDQLNFTSWYNTLRHLCQVRVVQSPADHEAQTGLACEQSSIFKPLNMDPWTTDGHHPGACERAVRHQAKGDRPFGRSTGPHRLLLRPTQAYQVPPRTA